MDWCVIWGSVELVYDFLFAQFDFIRWQRIALFDALVALQGDDVTVTLPLGQSRWCIIHSLRHGIPGSGVPFYRIVIYDDIDITLHYRQLIGCIKK